MGHEKVAIIGRWIFHVRRSTEPRSQRLEVCAYGSPEVHLHFPFIVFRLSSFVLPISCLPFCIFCILHFSFVRFHHLYYQFLVSHFVFAVLRLQFCILHFLFVIFHHLRSQFLVSYFAFAVSLFSLLLWRNNRTPIVQWVYIRSNDTCTITPTVEQGVILSHS